MSCIPCPSPRVGTETRVRRVLRIKTGNVSVCAAAALPCEAADGCQLRRRAASLLGPSISALNGSPHLGDTEGDTVPTTWAALPKRLSLVHIFFAMARSLFRCFAVDHAFKGPRPKKVRSDGWAAHRAHRETGSPRPHTRP